jgi:hypothetical protein
MGDTRAVPMLLVEVHVPIGGVHSGAVPLFELPPPLSEPPELWSPPLLLVAPVDVTPPFSNAPPAFVPDTVGLGLPLHDTIDQARRLPDETWRNKLMDPTALPKHGC